MPSSSSTMETPILIVGGGPVGLALAIDLGMRGASCLLIEQGEGPPDHPRATALNSRSMEFMRRWGIAGAVHAAGTPEDFPHTALYCTTFAGYEIARIERPDSMAVVYRLDKVRNARSAAISSFSTPS